MVVLFLVPVAAFAVYWRVNTWVAHTLDVEVGLGALRAAMDEAESSQRGFRLYGADEHRTRYDEALQRVDALLARISGLTEDNPVQRANLDRLRASVERKRASMRRALEALARGEPQPSPHFGLSTMDAVHADIEAMTAEEDRLLDKRILWQGVLLWVTGLAAVIFLAVTGWLIHMNTEETRRRLNAAREEQEQLSRALADRDVLLREVNHRVKNSLQMVSAILTMQSVQAGEEVRANLNRAAARIQTIAAIHQRLYQSDRFRTLALAPHLADLCADVVRTMGDDKSCTTDVPGNDPVEVPLEIGVPAGMMVNELVTNAFKHGGRHVGMTLRRDPGQIVLTVCDDGPGVPPGFDFRENGSLGWKLIEGFARQLQARIETVPLETGACFRVTIPFAGTGQDAVPLDDAANA